jgi:hypothetical protein
VTGVLAVERGGNHRWVYRQTEAGGVRRVTHAVDDLGRLSVRVRTHLPDAEVPEP